jgi:aspartate 1-decarboxylase
LASHGQFITNAGFIYCEYGVIALHFTLREIEKALNFRLGRLTQRLECHPYKVEVTGSNPVSPIDYLRTVPLPRVIMSITVCTGKLHCVQVTAAKLDYEGSITIDPVLMAAAEIVPFQLLHINSMANAVHWETYAIPGKSGSGEICLNGCPARLFQPGDRVIILSLEQMTRKEAGAIEQKVVYVDKNNKPIRTEIKKASRFLIAKPKRH